MPLGPTAFLTLHVSGGGEACSSFSPGCTWLPGQGGGGRATLRRSEPVLGPPCSSPSLASPVGVPFPVPSLPRAALSSPASSAIRGLASVAFGRGGRGRGCWDPVRVLAGSLRLRHKGTNCGYQATLQRVGFGKRAFVSCCHCCPVGCVVGMDVSGAPVEPGVDVPPWSPFPAPPSTPRPVLQALLPLQPPLPLSSFPIPDSQTPGLRVEVCRTRLVCARALHCRRRGLGAVSAPHPPGPARAVVGLGEGGGDGHRERACLPGPWEPGLKGEKPVSWAVMFGATGVKRERGMWLCQAAGRTWVCR